MFKITSSSLYKQICNQGANRVSASLRLSGILGPGKSLIDFMQANKLADKNETVFEVFNRSTKFLAEAGNPFYSNEEVISKHQQFLEKVCNFEVILGSPILTNAGRREKSLSACSIPPVDLSLMNQEEISNMVGQYHTRGMGTGFCLDSLEDPIEMVKFLNENAIKEVQSGKIERSCGNMGVLNINHPKVIDFIRVKTDNPQIKEWKFNLSVNFTHEFVESLTKNQPFKLSNGEFVNPHHLMQQIAENAHGTGDPGLIFMDTINELNRVPQAGRYESVVPCGEVALFKGEVCQFAYLNLLQFIQEDNIDLDKLRTSVHTIVEMLDNAVEANISRMPNQTSQNIINSVRRIGVGICGYAETIQSLGLSYGSEEALRFGANVMSFINYESKKASILLAQKRGPFPLFNHPQTKKELFIEPFAKIPTDFVTEKDWDKLKQLFSEIQIRNISTTILPPTGRSSLMAAVTGSIEPTFRLVGDENFQNALEKQLKKHKISVSKEEILDEVSMTGSVENTNLPQKIKEIFKTATELTPEAHITTVAMFQKHIDEGISKTVNIPNKATVEDVIKTYLKAHALGLKGITIYRDGCRIFQPKILKSTEKKSMTTITDPIYGKVEISERIQSLLNTDLVQRLKNIHQNGVAYFVDPRQSTSRFEHSVGVMLLTKILGGDESTQIAALLHDISHTAFSHLGDQIFVNEQQNHHDLIREQFLQSQIAKEALEKLGIGKKELDLDQNPIVKGVGLNTDRIDYMIRDLKAVNRIYQPQFSSILNNLTVDKSGQIKCQNIETARLVFDKFLEVNQEVYFDPKVEANTLVMTTILSKMLEKNELLESDFLLSDDRIIEKVKSGSYNNIFQKMGSHLEFSISNQEKGPHILRKLRFIDPEIVGLEGKLTDHCPESKQKLEQYLKTPTKVYYEIPLLSEIS